MQTELKSKNLPPKAVLVLDNAPSHPEHDLKSDDGNITCYFLPPNATPLIQPMDQSVIETLKRLYRKRFIRRLVSDDDGISLKEYWKQYNLKLVVDNVSESWADLTNETLKRAWNQLWPETEMLQSDTSETGETDESMIQFLTETGSVLSLENDEIIEWLNCDRSEMGYQLMTDDEIIDLARVDGEETDSEPDDYDGGEISNVEALSQKDLREDAKEAVGNIQKFMDWYEQQNDSNNTDAMILRRLRNFAQKKSEATVKQSKLTTFFRTS